MQDFAQFHRHLLGIDPDKTPSIFRISPSHQRIYSEVQNGKHGCLFSHQANLENWDHFLAIFIVAYALTNEGKVFLAVSGSTRKWVLSQIETVARHIFATRKSAPRPTLVQLFQNFQLLTTGSNILQIHEPPRWLAYGFHDKDILAPWMRGKLAAVKSKPESMSDETRAD